MYDGSRYMIDNQNFLYLMVYFKHNSGQIGTWYRVHNGLVLEWYDKWYSDQAYAGLSFEEFIEKVECD